MLKFVKPFGKLENYTFLYQKYFFAIMSDTATQPTSENKVKNEKRQSHLYATSPLIVEDELDRLKKVVYLFSCFRKASGQSSKTLRPRLVVLLALYLKYGVSNKTKDKAAEIFEKGRSDINSMNLELRNDNYLIKDKYNTRINHLHKDLEVLQKYVESGEGKDLCFLFTIRDADA